MTQRFIKRDIHSRKETCERDIYKRRVKETYLYTTHMFVKRDIYSTKETCKRDLYKGRVRETYRSWRRSDLTYLCNDSFIYDPCHTPINQTYK